MDTRDIIQGHNSTDYTKESVKLIRNSKGFTWEIKICSSDVSGLFTENDLKRLRELEEKLFNEYGEKI